MAVRIIRPSVPVAVHQIFGNQGIGFGEVWVQILGVFVQLDRFCVQNPVHGFCIQKTVHAALNGRDCFSIASVRVHFPDLHLAVHRGKITDFLAVWTPNRILLADFRMG